MSPFSDLKLNVEAPILPFLLATLESLSHQAYRTQDAPPTSTPPRARQDRIGMPTPHSAPRTVTIHFTKPPRRQLLVQRAPRTC